MLRSSCMKGLAVACRACWGGKAKLRHRLQAAMEGEEDALYSILGWLGGDNFPIIYNLRT